MKFEAKYQPPVPVKPKLDSVTITLNEKEAGFLQAVLGKINGYDGFNTLGFRDFTSALWKELYAVSGNLYPHKDRISGLLTIK